MGASAGSIAAAIGAVVAAAAATFILQVARARIDQAAGALDARITSWITRKIGRQQPTAQETMEQRIDVLSRNMTESAALIAQVSAEMELRRAEVDRLKREQDQAEATRSLTEEQLNAIRDQLAVAVRPETNRSIRWSIYIGVLSFMAGALAALAVALFVHPLG